MAAFIFIMQQLTFIIAIRLERKASAPTLKSQTRAGYFVIFVVK